MFQDQLVDYRVEFSKWWVTEFKTIKFPSAGTVFDYQIDRETKKFMPWTDTVPKFELDPEVPLQVIKFTVMLFINSVTNSSVNVLLPGCSCPHG